MRALTRIIGASLLLGLLVGSLAVAWYGTRFVFEQFGKVDPTIATISVIASVTLLLAAQILATGARSALQQEAENERLRTLIVVYRELLEFWWTASSQGKPVEEYDLPKPAELQLLLEGSPTVVRYYRDLRNQALRTNRAPATLLGQLTHAMRKDLGRSNFDLKGGGFLGTNEGDGRTHSKEESVDRVGSSV